MCNSFTGFLSFNCAHYFFEYIEMMQYTGSFLVLICYILIYYKSHYGCTRNAVNICIMWWEFLFVSLLRKHRDSTLHYISWQLVFLSHISNIYDICAFVVTWLLQDFCSSDSLHSLCSWNCFSSFQVQKSL